MADECLHEPKVGRGLCRPCYSRWYAANGPRATCHPRQLRTRRSGLCATCGAKARHRADPTSPAAARARLGKRLNKSRWNITAYDAALARQGGRCAICRALPPDGTRLEADHNHRTGMPRGLLCSPCNIAVGVLGDAPEPLFVAVVAYIEAHRVAA